MAEPLSPSAQQMLNDGFSHLTANKYYVLASTVLLVYDHLLTLEGERRYIWRQKRTLPTYLFFIFRYTTPIISIINLIGEHAPWWTGPICTNWIWLPVASGVIVSGTTGVILILRVHAIYARARWVLFIAIPVYLTQMAVMIYAMCAGTAASLPPGFVGCVPAEKTGTGHRLSYMYIAALAFDAMIFLFTFGRAIHMRITSTTVPIWIIIFRDGTLYFTVLFAVNLVNVLLFTLATESLSAINAPFATIITSVLVARLMINLREAGRKTFHVSRAPRFVPTHSMGVSNWDSHPAPIPPSKSTSLPMSYYVPRKDRTRRNTTLNEMIGLDEFDAPLGEGDETSTYDSRRSSIGIRPPHGGIYH